NFSRSVVLLCEHNDDGSFGLVFNKPSILKINEILEDFDFLDLEGYVGGPVEQNTLHYVYCGKKELEGSIQIGENLWWGGDFEELVSRLKTGTFDLENIRFFLGYSGWAPGQLKDELTEDTWIICKEEVDRETFHL